MLLGVVEHVPEQLVRVKVEAIDEVGGSGPTSTVHGVPPVR
jgi:hypothetical protein